MTPLEDDHDDEPTEIMLALRVYRAAMQAGERPNRREFLARYPHLADELAECLDGLEFLRAAAPGLSTPCRHVPLLPEPVEGTLGDFRLVREIGRGGMGVVYEAEQISLRRRVALKILPFASALDPRQLQRFKNEATAAGLLRHENVVPVIAIGCERGVHYYAMQYIEGQSLAALIAELQQQGKSPDHSQKDPLQDRGTRATTVAGLSTERSLRRRQDFDWVANLGRQAALALEHAHQSGIVHRDVKPGNLLLDTRGQLWVTDFGLALVAGDSGLTVTGELLGTLRYTSPEQAIGKRGIVDPRSDIYSLGATLYELLTLRPPFQGRDRHELLRQIAQDDPPSLRSLNPAIPGELETIILKALRKEPLERYATAQEFAEDLQRFLERQPILARRASLPERFRTWARRHPAALLVAAITMLLITVTSLLSAALVRKEQERTQTEKRRAEQAFRREHQRAEEAEARLKLARRAVDELCRVSEEELANRPGTELLQKRLLLSALSYYQEFLKERRDDSTAQAEILETTQRVVKILADLAVLRTASRFYLLCQPVVLDDLHLTPHQRSQIKELTARVGKEWMASIREIGLLPPSERGCRMVARARVNEADLNRILTLTQQTRLRQIGLQAEGASAFRDPEVVLALELTPEQRERIRVLEDEAAFWWMRPHGRGPSTGNFSSTAETREGSPNDRILPLLTQEQARKWRELTGPPVRGALAPFGMPITPSTTRSGGIKAP